MAHKVDMSSPILDWDGETTLPNRPRVECPECGYSSGAEPLTLRDVCLSSLGAGYQDEQNLKSSEKFKRFRLGTRLAEGDEVELVPSEQVLLTELINKRYVSPLIVARACLMIDPDAGGD